MSEKKFQLIATLDLFGESEQVVNATLQADGTLILVAEGATITLKPKETALLKKCLA